MNRANKLILDLANYSDPFLGVVAIIYIAGCQFGMMIIYPNLELIIQFPLICLFELIMYMMIIEKHKKYFDKLSCCLRQGSVMYLVCLFKLRDRFMQENRFKKLRVAIMLIITVVAIMISVLKSPQLQAFGSTMYYDNEEVSQNEIEMYTTMQISQVIVMWLVIIYHVLYGCGKYLIYLTISVLFCPCLFCYMIFNRGNQQIEIREIPNQLNQRESFGGYQGSMTKMQRQRQDVQEWIERNRIQYKKLIPQAQAAQCSICLNNFQKRDYLVQLKCNIIHRFHYDCIKVWGLSKISCPLCRQDIVPIRQYVTDYEVGLNGNIIATQRIVENTNPSNSSAQLANDQNTNNLINGNELQVDDFSSNSNNNVNNQNSQRLSTRPINQLEQQSQQQLDDLQIIVNGYQ
ncbi:ring finger family protein [Stylonychia lemnae]|uniref:RING-type E3 ubiquitin transferase n=1 Tax=Stylonychia lemnae TaxID=5949 RepID=A0A078AF16_STYLE|nr:ring finger family protein [Stylonychia lemnae]|eukprot:CDW80859.1 ring finger family protein [Stylonychia lemnae]